MTKRIVFNAAIAAKIHTFVSKETSRYYLQGIHVQAHPLGGVIVTATDGHRLGTMHDPDGTCPPNETAIIKLNAATLKACKSNKGTPPKGIYIDIDPDSPLYTTAAVGFGDLEEESKDYYLNPDYWPKGGACEAMQAACLIDGTFPDWSRVVPRYDAETAPLRICLNAKLLATFAAVSDSGSAVDVIPTDDKGAGPMIVLIGDQPNFLGVIMPMRGKEMHRPAWMATMHDSPVAQAAE